jgi:hypothetical protein
VSERQSLRFVRRAIEVEGTAAAVAAVKLSHHDLAYVKTSTDYSLTEERERGHLACEMDPGNLLKRM